MGKSGVMVMVLLEEDLCLYSNILSFCHPLPFNVALVVLARFKFVVRTSFCMFLLISNQKVVLFT